MEAPKMLQNLKHQTRACEIEGPSHVVVVAYLKKESINKKQPRLHACTSCLRALPPLQLNLVKVTNSLL